jgi:transposase
MQVVTLGLDIGKRVFHVVGLDEHSHVVLREKLTREQLRRFIVTHPPCVLAWRPVVERSTWDGLLRPRGSRSS